MVNVCGTGGWGGPLPGDPDNNVILSATPAFGGIDVTWTYPQINSHAVAHVLLYRGTNSNFVTAVGRAVVAGNFFYDKVNVGQLYFYWIKIVSINGTTGELIGPASATARPLIQDLIEELTGKIDQGLLAVSLKTTLDGISTVNTNLNNEIFDRQSGNTSFAQALISVQNGVAQANTFITTEISSRVSANQALAEQINLVSATLGGDIAAVTVSANAWISPLATTNGKVTSLGALYTAKVTVNGLVGGFGIFNDSTTVEAGFDVDTFWVGRTAANKRKPFIIVGTETFIDQAVINKLTFSKLTDEAGTFIVENGQVKANYIDTNGLVIRDAAGTAIFGSGTDLDWSRITGTNIPANNATRNITATGLLANRPVGANGDFYYGTDSFALYQKIAGNWVIAGTVGAPSGTLINGVAVSSVTSAITNFNSSNDRNATAITAPTITVDNSALDHSIRTNGSADISFEWVWSGDEGDIDGFQIFIRASSNPDPYTFGVNPTSETLYEMPASKRAFILFGVVPNQSYTFGVLAYRNVDKDIAATGIIVSTLVQPSLTGENPYLPSSTVAFSGNVIGTVNGISAASVNVWAHVGGTGKPDNNATVGANSFNLDVGMTSGNFISNSGPAPGSSAGFSVGNNSTGLAPSPVAPSFDPWRPAGQGGVYLTFPGTPANGTYCNLNNGSIRYPVIVGKKYEISAYASTHRCTAAMGVVWYDGNSNYISETTGAVLGEYAAGGPLSNWARIGLFVIAPPNAATASVFIRSNYSGLSSPYLFTSMWYFGYALEAQTVLSQWTDGSGDITAQNTAKNVAGQGSLATLNFAKIGETVSFGNNEIMQTGDFVNRLSKLSVDNIGTFMEGAAIGKAYIGNAAIGTAQIGDLEVSTLKIANDAITVPNGAAGAYWAELNMDVGTNARVAIIATFRQGNLRASQIVSLYVNNDLVTAESPNSATVASMIHFQTCTGMTKFRISANTEVGDMNCRLLVIGIKK